MVEKGRNLRPITSFEFFIEWAFGFLNGCKIRLKNHCNYIFIKNFVIFKILSYYFKNNNNKKERLYWRFREIDKIKMLRWSLGWYVIVINSVRILRKL